VRGEKKMSIGKWMKHLANLYGRRNRIFLPGLADRIDFLNLAIGDLQEAIRKGFSKKAIGVALARVGARIFCVAEHFWSLPLAETMSRKFPEMHCSYCKWFPCRCSENRQNYVLERISPVQVRWNLSKWQEHLGLLYGSKNRDKGIENILNRLFKEITELSAVRTKVPRMDYKPDKIEEKFALELVDALAWTCAVANYFDIDLEQAVMDRFGNGCWKCAQNPCRCSYFNVEPVDWNKVKV
jgi:NTP pyrophosphatase (non-canonical NTP hydrolase)